jgi:hypothetical protein
MRHSKAAMKRFSELEIDELLPSLPVSEAKTGRGAKRSTLSRPIIVPARRKPVSAEPLPTTMCLRLGGSL